MPLLLHSLQQAMAVKTPSSMRKAAPSVVTSMCQEPSKNQDRCDLVNVRDDSYQLHKPGMLTPSRSMLNSDPSSSVMTGSHQGHCTNQLKSTDIRDCIQRKNLPTGCNAAPICLAPMASCSDVNSSEVYPGCAGLPIKKILSSGVCHQSVIPEVGNSAAGRSGHTLRKRHSSLRGSCHRPVIPEAGEFSARGLKYLQKKKSSSSKEKRTSEPVIAGPGAVMTGRPKYPQRKGSSSSKDRSRRYNSSLSKQRRDKSPAQPNKQHLREVSQTVLSSLLA